MKFAQPLGKLTTMFQAEVCFILLPIKNGRVAPLESIPTAQDTQQYHIKLVVVELPVAAETWPIEQNVPDVGYRASLAIR